MVSGLSLGGLKWYLNWADLGYVIIGFKYWFKNWAEIGYCSIGFKYRPEMVSSFIWYLPQGNSFLLEHPKHILLVYN